MASRVTRGAAAREAAKVPDAAKELPEKETQKPGTIAPQMKKPAMKKTVPKKKNVKASPPEKVTAQEADSKTQGDATTPTVNGANTSKKRKRAPAPKPKPEVDPDELPHGMGKLWKPSPEETIIEGAHGSEVPATISESKEGVVMTEENHKHADKPLLSPASPQTDVKKVSQPKKPRTKKGNTKKTKVDPTPATTSTQAGDPILPQRIRETNTYGLKPGTDPYPSFPHPTIQECHHVNDLLSSLHGTITPPDKIPEPSLEIAGCGEVPSVLDAMIRTMLSANTHGSNSASAFKGLVDEYGLQDTGIGKGSVNWDAVRRSPLAKVQAAIKSGGNHIVKGARLKRILDDVYLENQTRRAALVASLNEPSVAESDALVPKGGSNESREAKELEIARADADILSMDHLHSLSTADAFRELISFPGIGPKTASCILLFCLRRPSFAVDTHVFRICSWLGWAPQGANEVKMYAHLDQRVPDGLKYSLHQLFIKHGKSCGRCEAKGREGTERWEEGCVIDELVTRVKGGKAGGKAGVKAKKSGKGRKKEGGDEGGDEGEEAADDDSESDFAAPAKKRAKKATPTKSPAKPPKRAEKSAPKPKAAKPKHQPKTSKVTED